MNFNPFHDKIGIVGGGQLGKMLIESGLPWNIEYNILDPDKTAPASRYASVFVNGSLTSREKIIELAEHSDLITYEIEHIDVETLIELKSQGKTVIPDPEILRIIQDKSLQKQFFSDNHIATSTFALFNNQDSLHSALEIVSGEKVVVKSGKGGYDGKGVWVLRRHELVSGRFDFPLDGSTYVLEQFVPNAREIAVIVARGMDGEIKSYPSCEMVFDPKLNLVDYLISPSSLNEEKEREAEELALKAVSALGGAGLFAVELFLDESDTLYVNEIAPRPHNSGHHSIEANKTSQYEQLNRILLGLPLGETDLTSPVVMMNLLGDEGISGPYVMEGLENLMQSSGTHFHWYNKAETRPGRKMGHLTVCSENVEEALAIAKNVRSRLKMKPRS